MRYGFALFALLAAALLAGCDSQKFMKSLTPQPEVEVAKIYIEDIRTRNFAPVRAKMDPQYSAGLEQAFGSMAAIFPAGPPKTITLIGSNTINSGAVTTYQLSYEYEFSKGWLGAEVVLQKNGGDERIEGIHLYPLKDSLENIHAFTFAGKGLTQYVFLFSAISFPLFILVTAYICWRTPIPRFKWFWRLFVLFGLIGLRLNWTTGAVDYQLLQITLLGIAYTKNPYGPLLLQIALPIGAIIFWFRRPAWLKQSAAESVENF